MKQKLTRTEFIKQVEKSKLIFKYPKVSGYDLNKNGGFNRTK